MCSAVAAAWLAVVCVAVTPAHAQDESGPGAIEVEVAGDARPGFVQALAIQFAGVARVDARAPLAGSSIASRRDAAEEFVAGERTRVVLWFEAARGDAGRALYVVGRGPAGVRVEVFVATTEPSFDDDRELALKVRAAVDAIAAGTPSPRGTADEPPAPPPPQPTVAPAPVEAPPAGPPAIPERTSFIGARLGASPPAGSPAGQVLFGAAIGATWNRPMGYLGGYGVLEGATALEEENDAGRVTARELVALAGARIGVDRGAWRLGGAAEAGARVVFASGETTGGTEGDGVAYVPTVRLLGEAQWSPFASREPGWRLRLAAGVEVSPRRQRFAVNQRDVLDLGRARPLVQLAVLFALP